MKTTVFHIAAVFIVASTTASATTFTFATDPFAGTTALTTPGRQVIGNEDFISFSPATDVYAVDLSVFGVSSLNFANNTIGNIPATGVNVVVLETFDNDANPATPFGAGNAADLIAGQITTSAPGFFIYFNSGLNLPRLVYSTDLSDNTADLKVLARMTNLSGQTGALASFTAANFTATPEPSTISLIGAVGILAAFGYARRRSARHSSH
jgi:hypothetical protein